MITNAILSIFVSLLAFFIRGIPTISLPAAATSAFENVGNYIAPIAQWIPFDVFLICVGVYFVVWLACAVTSALLQLL